MRVRGACAAHLHDGEIIRVEARALIEDALWVDRAAEVRVVVACLVDDTDGEHMITQLDLSEYRPAALAVLDGVGHGVAMDMQQQTRVDVDHRQRAALGQDDDWEERRIVCAPADAASSDRGAKQVVDLAWDGAADVEAMDDLACHCLGEHGLET